MLPECVRNHGTDCLMWSESPLLREDQKQGSLSLSRHGFLLQRLVEECSGQLPWQQAGSRGTYPLVVFVGDLLSSACHPTTCWPWPHTETSVETVLAVVTSTTLIISFELPVGPRSQILAEGCADTGSPKNGGIRFLPSFLSPALKAALSCQQPVSATSPLMLFPGSCFFGGNVISPRSPSSS